MADHCIQCKGTGPDSYRVEMPNGTGNFRNFYIARKKDNPREVDKFWKQISRNFLFIGMERAPDFIFLEWSTSPLMNTILGHYGHFWIFWRESFGAFSGARRLAK